jgi:hypothetical protein
MGVCPVRASVMDSCLNIFWHRITRSVPVNAFLSELLQFLEIGLEKGT